MPDVIVKLSLDADNNRFVAQVTDTSGTVLAGWGSIKLEVGLNPGGVPANPGTTMGKEIILRETKGCNDAGEPRYCMLLRSEWYTTAITSNPTT